jgi:predicted RNA-binding protein with PIN domain
MPLLIDGHNLIGQMRDLSLSDPHDEDKLIARLRSVAERTQKRITVVFDPNPADTTPRIGHGKSQHGNLTVVFAAPGRKADDLIRLHVGEAKDKQGLIVVTSDAAVADFTRRCGIRVQSSGDFIQWMDAQLNTKARHDANTKPLGSAREVMNWADVFKEPAPQPGKGQKKPPVPPLPKGKKRSEQLKQQVKKSKPLF